MATRVSNQTPAELVDRELSARAVQLESSQERIKWLVGLRLDEYQLFLGRLTGLVQGNADPADEPASPAVQRVRAAAFRAAKTTLHNRHLSNERRLARCALVLAGTEMLLNSRSPDATQLPNLLGYVIAIGNRGPTATAADVQRMIGTPEAPYQPFRLVMPALVLRTVYREATSDFHDILSDPAKVPAPLWEDTGAIAICAALDNNGFALEDFIAKRTLDGGRTQTYVKTAEASIALGEKGVREAQDNRSKLDNRALQIFIDEMTIPTLTLHEGEQASTIADEVALATKEQSSAFLPLNLADTGPSL